MPYSGADDPNLPDNVKRLPATRRRQWVHVWNSAYQKCQKEGGSGCEGRAFRQANSVALAADELTTYDIPDVEILSVGTWNDVPFTAERLDDIVEAHQATRGVLDPPVKLGHDEGQALIQKDGFPAAGWVENLRRIGDRLVADFKRVPAAVARLIEAGSLRKRSSEIRFDMDLGGRTWPAVLVGVSLLGEDIPAVSSLADIERLYHNLSLDLDEGATPVVAELAVWGTAYINDLPDSAFAGVSPGGTKDAEGKTTPRSLRHLPHHDQEGNLDATHVRAALRRLQDVEGASVTLRRRMLTHLKRHASQAGVTSEVELELSKTGRLIEMEDELRELLGLDDSSDPLPVVKGLLELSTGLRGLLKLKEGETIIEKVTELSQRPEKVETPTDGKGDPQEVVTLRQDLDAAQKRILTLEGEAGRARATSLVDSAIEQGQLLPVQREQALKLALRDEEGFKSFVATQPKGLVQLGEKGSEGDGTGVDLSDLEPTASERQVAEQLGQWSEKYRIDLIRQKAAERGVKLPADFGKEIDKQE